jgi:hypothetical protein
LERVEDGVAEEAERNEKGGFFVDGKPAIGDTNDGDADGNDED